MATLVHVRADGERCSYVLKAPVMSVGRADGADIQLDEPLVSRMHANIERLGAGWVLRDLDSRNYTRVNGQRIHEHQLRHGDEILFARARCLFLEADESKEPSNP
jgi:penicillin-binding protein 1A